MLRELDDNAEAGPGSALDRLTGLENTRRTLAESAGVGVAAFVIACIIYRIWEVARTVPFTYSGDAILHATYVDRMGSSWWYINNDRLGAPFGLDASDFPLGGENAHWLTMKVLGWFLPNYGATMNAYLLLTYALIAAAGYLVCRIIGLRRWTAVTIAILYSFLPYHQWRGVSHMLRSGYYIVPLLVLAVLWLGNFRGHLRSNEGRGWFGIRKDRLLAIGVLGIVVGGSDTQNAAYGALLLIIVGTAVSLAAKDFRPIAVALMFGLLAGGSLVVNNSPFVLNRLHHGANLEVANRPLTDQETYALRPAHLLLPVSQHRLAPLAELKGDVVSEVPVGENSQSLGVLGSAGLVTIVTAAIATGFISWRSQRHRLAATLGVLSMLLIAISTAQGWAFLMSIAGIDMLRTWNRTSIFVAFFALIGFGLLAESVSDRVPTTRLNRQLAASIAAAMFVVFGVLDQVPSRGIVQSQATRDDFTSDRAFYESVEATLDRGAMVYQFPVIPFPEAGHTHGLGDYEQQTAYLHSEELRWSGGAMRGRDAYRWHEANALLDPYEQVLTLASAGFDGAVVYRKAYPAGVGDVEDALRSLTGEPSIVNERRQLAFYDLRGARELFSGDAAEQDAARSDVLDPVRIQWKGELYQFEPGPPTFRWSARNEVELELTNPREGPLSVALEAQLTHFDPRATTIEVEGPFGMTTVELSTGARVPLHLEFDLPPGTSTVTFSSDGTPQVPDTGDTRVLALQVAGMSVLTKTTANLICSATISDGWEPDRCAAAEGT